MDTTSAKVSVYLIEMFAKKIRGGFKNGFLRTLHLNKNQNKD